MVTITLGDVTTGASGAATTQSHQRKMFHNPRGLQRYYVFYTKYSPRQGLYGWSADIDTWPGAQVDLAAMTTTDVQTIAAIFVEDAGNAQTVVYVAGDIPDGNVYLRRGTIADAASLIVWSTEEEIYGISYYPRTFNICMDLNGYLWAGACYDYGGYDLEYRVKASTGTIPGAPIGWTAETALIRATSGYWYIAMVAYGNGVVAAGIRSGKLVACYSQYGTPPTDEGDVDGVTSYTYVGGGPCVLDADNIVHCSFGGSLSSSSGLYYYHRPFNPALGSWGTRTTIYGGHDNTRHAPLLVCDTSRTPNYLYAIYEHGTGVIEYVSTPADAIGWSGATEIEDHAEDCQYIVGWYTDDPIVAGNIYGAFTTQSTMTVRTFLLDFVAPAGVTYFSTKEKGWPKWVRGKKFFLDADTFVGQDERRWDFETLADVEDDTGFAWSTQGQVTVPADHKMTTKDKDKYAYCILTAVVQSADMSDCAIGFYADANHYAWVDRDSLRTRNGLLAEDTTDISASLPNATWLKIILIWTALHVRLIVINIGTGARAVYQHSGPHQVESNVTFQVIAAGSNLLAQDYALFDAEDDLMYLLEILRYVTADDALAVSLAAAITVDVDLQPLTSIIHAQVNNINNAAAALICNTASSSITIIARSTNVGNVYLGDAGVLTTNGAILEPGMSVSLDVDCSVDAVYGISDNGTEDVSYIGLA